jgi:hypothetical protein
MRTLIPKWVDGLYGLKPEQVLPGRISLSEQGLFAELVVGDIFCKMLLTMQQGVPHAPSGILRPA